MAWLFLGSDFCLLFIVMNLDTSVHDSHAILARSETVSSLTKNEVGGRTHLQQQ